LGVRRGEPSEAKRKSNTRREASFASKGVVLSHHVAKNVVISRAEILTLAGAVARVRAVGDAPSPTRPPASARVPSLSSPRRGVSWRAGDRRGPF
jgi:hypothetical protein